MPHEIKLRPYQEAPYEKMCRLNGLIAGLADMRAGKTVLTCKYILDQGKSAFIFMPTWVINVWWKHLREKDFPFDDYEVYDLSKDSGLSVPQRTDIVRRLCTPRRLWVALVNIEATWREPLDTAIARAATKSKAIVAIDEAHCIAKRPSRQSKYAGRLGKRDLGGRIPLTGTPTGRHLEDYWSLYRFTNPSVFPTVYKHFESRYVLKGGYYGHEVVGYQNTAELKSTIRANSFQITRQQAGIQDPEDIPIYVKLGAKATEHYKRLEKEAYALIEGYTSTGRRETRELLVQRAITEILRLQQLASGIVGTPSTGYIYVDDAKHRRVVQIAESYIMQHRKPAIFCRFLPEIQRLCEHFKLPLHRTFSGYASAQQRMTNLRDFERDDASLKSLPVLICQIHAISRGQDLSMADCTIVMSAGVGLRTFQQAMARDLGPDYVPQHFLVIAENTVDVKTYEGFARDQRFAALVSGLSYTKRLFSLMQ